MHKRHWDNVATTYTICFSSISCDQYSSQAAHWPTVPSQGQCREVDVCQHTENVFGQTKRGLSQTTISWPFTWIFLNQPWIWQHMHKITKSKSIHIHTIRVYVCVCSWWGAFFLTGRQWYFMQGRQGYELSGRCSCSRGGAVMQPSL